MRCEVCRDPDLIPKFIEVFRDCAPLYYARDEVAVQALVWWRGLSPDMRRRIGRDLDAALVNLDAVERARRVAP